MGVSKNRVSGEDFGLRLSRFKELIPRKGIVTGGPGKLLEINLYGLVAELTLAHFFGEPFQSEKAGGIAFIDRNFKVTGTVEKCQLFTFGNIRIAFADTVNHFVAFENNPETPALSLFFKLFMSNIDNHVFKTVDKYDLAFNGIALQQGTQVSFFDIGYIGYADVFYGLSVYELIDRVAHYGRDIRGGFGHCFFQRDADYHFRAFFQYHGEQSVICTKNILVAVEGQQQLFRFFFEQVYQYQVIGKIGEVPDCGPAYICRLWVIEGRNIMGDIDNGKIRVGMQQLCLYCAHDIVGAANIGCKRNKRHVDWMTAKR